MATQSEEGEGMSEGTSAISFADPTKFPIGTSPKSAPEITGVFPMRGNGPPP